MSDVLQIDISGMVYTACSSSKAKVGVTLGHRMADQATHDDKPHDLVILSIERDGSDLCDTVALTAEAARAVAKALYGDAAIVSAIVSAVERPVP